MSTPEPTRIVAVRHGETDWNAAQRIQGHTDVPLNAAGRRQAAALARALAGEGFDAVYASDLARAADTAAGFAGDRLVLDPALRERRFGDFEGLSYAEIDRRWPAQALRWRRRDPHFAPAGGETLAEFHGRCVEAIGRLAGRHRGRHIAVVAHGGVLDSLYRAATRVALDAPRSWALDNAAVNRLLHSDGGFMLVGWNDRSHLDEPPDRPDLS